MHDYPRIGYAGEWFLPWGDQTPVSSAFHFTLHYFRKESPYNPTQRGLLLALVSVCFIPRSPLGIENEARIDANCVAELSASLVDNPEHLSSPLTTDLSRRTNMRIAIMQPYFFPYIGYYQLVRAVDLFVVYDNIKYTKKGWINRNRLLQNGKDVLFSLPLKNDSDHLNVCEREVAADFRPDKLLNQLKGAYQSAPYFFQTFPLVESVILHEDRNLFGFVFHSLVSTCRHLGITTEIRISSAIAIDHELRNQDKVLALCKAVGSGSYVNAIGGSELYSKQSFQERGIELKFIQSEAITYAQFGHAFVPWLSIIDVLMFNPVDTVYDWISNRYHLV